MIALLSGAWWAQKLSGIAAQAIGIALVVALVIGGIWWLRHDARMDERATWKGRLAAAALQAERDAKARERQSQELATQMAQERQDALAASEAARLDAETALAKRQRVIAYPKEITKALNQ